MDQWLVLAVSVVAELAGVAALRVRAEARSRAHRREVAARVDLARTVARGGRITEYYPDGTRRTVIEVDTRET